MRKQMRTRRVVTPLHINFKRTNSFAFSARRQKAHYICSACLTLGYCTS